MTAASSHGKAVTEIVLCSGFEKQHLTCLLYRSRGIDLPAGAQESSVWLRRTYEYNTKRQNELFSEVWKMFSQSCTDVTAQLPSAMLPRQARGTCKKTVIQTSETVHFVSWYNISSQIARLPNSPFDSELLSSLGGCCPGVTE